MVNIEKFCSDDTDPRWYLHKPFARSGFLYATNGHIAVRVPADGSMVDTEEKISDQIERLFSSNVFDGMEPLPAYTDPVLPACDDCEGSGKNKPTEKCKECRGEGFVEWDTDFNSYEADCKSCDGSGEIEREGLASLTCKTCAGSGTSMDGPVTIGGMTINYRYLKMMEELPGLLVTPLAGKICLDVIPFVFDGGTGLIMPMLPKVLPKIKPHSGPSDAT